MGQNKSKMANGIITAFFKDTWKGLGVHVAQCIEVEYLLSMYKSLGLNFTEEEKNKPSGVNVIQYLGS